MNAPDAYGQTAASDIWLGASDRDVPASYAFTACPINDLLRIFPDHISIHTAVRTDTGAADSRACFYPKDAFARIAYTVEVPLAPAADFHGRTDQTVDEAFDADLIDYLFSSGSVEIYGQVTNSLPLRGAPCLQCPRLGDGIFQRDDGACQHTSGSGWQRMGGRRRDQYVFEPDGKCSVV